MARDLIKIFGAMNVAGLLDDNELAAIGKQAIDGYQADRDSLSEWRERNTEGMELAMQIKGPKQVPFQNPANVMYPLISVASIQFSARAYPNLVPGYDIVKGKVIGADPNGEKATKAKRIETHMNWQLNEEMTEWEEETDRLLTVLPIMGCCFKETYFSMNFKRIVSRYISPTDLIMHYKAQDMETVPRITKKYRLYPNEIIERIRAGLFLYFDVVTQQSGETKDQDEVYTNTDEYRPHLFLEQHTWIDLDDDGYAEPYILNIHYDTKKVVRIVPRFVETDISWNDKKEIKRIQAHQHYTRFTFMHSPDGAIYGLGFGSLLAPINHTVNSAINQMLDSGTLNNARSGWIGKNLSFGASKTGGVVELPLQGFLPVPYSGDDLRRNIVMLNEFMQPPSAVMFSLLGFMVNAGEKLSSVTELLLGEQTIHNEPATTSLARIEQGLKVFSAIHKRVYDSFSKELRLLFALNGRYLEEKQYFTVLDEPDVQQGINRSDYDKSSCDVIPTASPEDVSNAQKMIKAQALLGMVGQGFNDEEIKKRFIEALQIPNPGPILTAQPPPPDPKLVLQSEKLDLERDKFEFEMMKFGFEMARMQSEIILNLATAESKEIGLQLDQYKAQMQALVSLATKQQGNRTTASPPAPQTGMAAASPVEQQTPPMVGAGAMAEQEGMMEGGNGAGT